MIRDVLKCRKKWMMITAAFLSKKGNTFCTLKILGIDPSSITNLDQIDQGSCIFQCPSYLPLFHFEQ